MNRRIHALSSVLLVLLVLTCATAIALFDGLEIVFPRTFYISLYLVTAILAIYHFHIRKNPISITAILLLAILVVASISHLNSSDIGFYRETKNFPASSTGRAVFSALSIPVSALRSVLRFLGVELGWPIGLGLGIATLIVAWAAILTLLSRINTTLNLTAEREPVADREASPGSTQLITIGLLMVCLTAFCVRLPILLRYAVPVGIDTPFYIATMEGRIPFWRYPGISRLSYHFFMVLGSVLRTPFPIPGSQVLFIELIPLVLHTLAAFAMYGAGRRLTGDSRVGLIASTFSALSTSQLLHSWDLYKALLSISASLFAVQLYCKALETKRTRDTLLSLMMLSTAGLLHPYPASSLLYAILAFMPIQLILSAKEARHHFKITGYILLLLALVIFPVLGGRLFRPWPTNPVTPIWDMWDIFDSLGAQLIPLVLIGIAYSLSIRTEKNILLLTWFTVAFILAQQTLFLVYFPVDSPRFPRFLMLAYVPANILAATGLKKMLDSIRLTAPRRLYLSIDLPVKSIIVASCVITALGFVAFGNPSTIDAQEYGSILWMIEHTPEYTNSLAPLRFDAWTGYYAGLQSQENQHFYTVNVENDCNTIYNRIFDGGTYIHKKSMN